MNKKEKLKEMIQLAEDMWRDPLVYHYQDLSLAPDGTNSVFLAGPSSREDVLEYKWRIYAVKYLREAGFKGVIYVPEPREDDWTFKGSFPMPIVKWESDRILSATIAFFWLPRHPVQLPGRVTNTELGIHLGMAHENPDFKERMIFGCPEDAWKVKPEKHYANLFGVEVFEDLKTMCQGVVRKIQK